MDGSFHFPWCHRLIRRSPRYTCSVSFHMTAPSPVSNSTIASSLPEATTGVFACSSINTLIARPSRATVRPAPSNTSESSRTKAKVCGRSPIPTRPARLCANALGRHSWRSGVSNHGKRRNHNRISTLWARFMLRRRRVLARCFSHTALKRAHTSVQRKTCHLTIVTG